MKTILAVPIALGGLAGLPLPAAAQVPVAVVEEIRGNVPELGFMDYVAAGRVIRLGPNDSIVLGYLKSCWRETITGGTVVVGTEQSMTHQSKLERTKAECDGERAQLSSQQAADPAATVFRTMKPGQVASASGTPAPVTVYGLSPVFDVGAPDTLVIERVDRAGERLSIALRGKTLARGRFYDLAKDGKALSAGGSYVATVGGRRVAFRIDATAKAGATPIVGRLLRFE